MEEDKVRTLEGSTSHLAASPIGEWTVMARPAGNRGMWLLKITSKHHSPERLAWALALGVMLGLVPKLNLLAPCLYVLVFLPAGPYVTGLCYRCAGDVCQPAS